jgi:hypothetical protein
MIQLCRLIGLAVAIVVDAIAHFKSTWLHCIIVVVTIGAVGKQSQQEQSKQGL